MPNLVFEEMFNPHGNSLGYGTPNLQRMHKSNLQAMPHGAGPAVHGSLNISQKHVLLLSITSSTAHRLFHTSGSIHIGIPRANLFHIACGLHGKPWEKSVGMVAQIGTTLRLPSLVKRLPEEHNMLRNNSEYLPLGLLSAIEVISLTLVQHLIQTGADINAKTIGSDTLLHATLPEAQGNVAEFLMDKGCTNWE